MNYQKIYENLILRARHRIINGYFEKHHIIPKCLKGSDDPCNIVNLTPEEHYFAHLLLVKIHPHNRSLIYAAKMMAGHGTNKSYGWLRRKSSEIGFSDDHRKNISKSVKSHWENETLKQMQERWKKAELKRQLKKDAAIITALIYSIT